MKSLGVSLDALTSFGAFSARTAYNHPLQYDGKATSVGQS